MTERPACLDEVHCYGHRFSLFAEDLRKEIPLIDELIKFMLSVRKYFNASKGKISSLKKTCIKLGIKYKQIEEEFDVRYRAFMSAAIKSYTQMLPAYLVFFHEQDELNGDRLQLSIQLTKHWEYSALALSLKYQLERDELLDKKL